MRAAKLVLIVCLLCLATTAFADYYPLNPPPDLRVDTFFYNADGYLQGTVESITDVGNCSIFPCDIGFLTLAFYDSGQGPYGAGFIIYGTDLSDVYLLGTVIGQGVGLGGEAGVLNTVEFADAAKWNAIEGQIASSFGSIVALDLHNFDPNDLSQTYADFAPSTTPEPASMTLVIGGLALGLLRKKLR